MKIQPTDPEYTEYRLAMQLPHLPADKIPAGIEVIVNHLRKRTGDEAKVERFAKYMRRQWLSIVSPYVYSTYNVPTTSNNAAESFHSKLRREIGPSPAPWIFVEKIIQISQTIGLEIDRGQTLPFRREQSERQRQVRLCTEAYERERSILKFLLSLNTNKRVEFGCLPVVLGEDDPIDALEECVICKQCPEVSLIPCMHKPYCDVCMWEVAGKIKKCPICDMPWTGIIKDS
ncbi:hypothetical protein RP20_CCG003401 [Aedes albopictus]|nr:hypothetical protein RP20_CCG003401 [Aedes albopictus]